jgi:hypothetical protein
MATSRNRKHGMSKTKVYRSWCHMKARCLSPTDKKFRRYGGRGIIVCDRWMSSFENFYADMGPCPVGMTLDRKDNDGNYEPENCRWADYRTQRRNSSSTRPLEAFGRRWLMTDWARHTRLSESRIHYALKRNYNLEAYIREVVPFLVPYLEAA